MADRGLRNVLVPELFFLLVFLSAARAQEQKLEVTVYNRDLALIKDQREIKLGRGTNIIQFTDVAAKIDPASVHLKSTISPQDIIIEEQNFEKGDYEYIKPIRLRLFSIPVFTGMTRHAWVSFPRKRESSVVAKIASYTRVKYSSGFRVSGFEFESKQVGLNVTAIVLPSLEPIPKPLPRD